MSQYRTASLKKRKRTLGKLALDTHQITSRSGEGASDKRSDQMQMNGRAQSLVFTGDFNRIASVPSKYEKDVQNSILKDELRTRSHQLGQKNKKGEERLRGQPTFRNCKMGL